MGGAKISTGRVQNTFDREDYAPPPLKKKTVLYKIKPKVLTSLPLFLIERPLQRTIVIKTGAMHP